MKIQCWVSNVMSVMTFHSKFHICADTQLLVLWLLLVCLGRPSVTTRYQESFFDNRVISVINPLFSWNGETDKFPRDKISEFICYTTKFHNIFHTSSNLLTNWEKRAPRIGKMIRCTVQFTRNEWCLCPWKDLVTEWKKGTFSCLGHYGVYRIILLRLRVKNFLVFWWTWFY